ACVLLIVLFIRNELSFDRFHKDANRIFQVTLDGKLNGQEFESGNIAPPVGAALTNNIPEIETYTRFYKAPDEVVRYGTNGTEQKFFTEKNIMGVDSNFLQVLDFRMLKGDPATALMKPGSVVLTQDMAVKYFGTGEAIGKTLVVGQDKKPFLV